MLIGGDGTSETILSNKYEQILTHTYNTLGEYLISVWNNIYNCHAPACTIKAINNESTITTFCSYAKCIHLKEIDSGFKIPKTLRLDNMFNSCSSLTELPETFEIPDGVTVTDYMFLNCKNLSKFPSKFKLPDSIKYCNSMFSGIKAEFTLPETFSIPSSCISCRINVLSK